MAAIVVALAMPGTGQAISAGNTCRMYQSCAHHGTTYRVTRVKITRSIGSGYSRETTSGRFIVISITLTDTKSSPSTILASNLTLMSRRGDSYEVTDRAFAVFKNGLDLLENIQPHLPKADILVYELPASAVRGSVLQINDLWSGDKAKITLGI